MRQFYKTANIPHKIQFTIGLFIPDLLDSVLSAQTSNRYVNAILVRLKTGTSAEDTAEHIQRWQQLTVYTRLQMEHILISKMIATSARQIAMFS